MAMKGFVRNFPPLNILSDEDIESVHRGMLRVLSTTGVRLEHKRGLDVLEKAGCKVDRDINRVYMPPALVEECIRTAPSSFPPKDPRPKIAPFLVDCRTLSRSPPSIAS